MTHERVEVGGGAQVEDARGRKCSLCRVEDLGDVPPEVREAVRLGNEHRWTTRLIAAAIGLVIGVLMLVLIHWVFGLRFRAASVGGVVGAIVAAAFGAQVAAAGKVKLAVAACLKGEVCPGCGYSLSGLEEVDGGRVCPECGAVWKVK